MKTKTPLFLAGLAVGLALLVPLGLLLDSRPPAAYAAAAEPVVSNYVIMAPGSMSNGTACLWVVDTRNSETTPTLAFYMADPNGKLKLASARRIKYDFKLSQYNDASGSDLTPSKLKEDLDKMDNRATK
jgi:hypothetical protein